MADSNGEIYINSELQIDVGNKNRVSDNGEIQPKNDKITIQNYDELLEQFNSGQVHLEDIQSQMKSGIEYYNKLLEDFKEKNLVVIIHRDQQKPALHRITVVDPNNEEQVNNLNINVVNEEGSATKPVKISTWTHGTWAENHALEKTFRTRYKETDCYLLFSNSPHNGAYATTSDSKARAIKQSRIINKILAQNKNKTKELTSGGCSLGIWHHLNVMDNLDVSNLNNNDKFNIQLKWIPTFGPFITSVDEQAELFKKVVKKPEIQRALNDIDIEIAPERAYKFHDPKATLEFYNNCCCDADVIGILNHKMNGKTHENICKINPNRKTFLEKLMLIITTVCTVLTIVGLIAILARSSNQNKSVNNENSNLNLDNAKQNKGNGIW
ncbi:MAG: hypothetical protein IJT14_04385 [Rickettsiales bacterium]|nr:hypothetical protein [Rickettsiales bacterium]